MKNNDVNIDLSKSIEEKKVSAIVNIGRSIVDTIAYAKWTKIVKVYLVMFFFSHCFRRFFCL